MARGFCIGAADLVPGVSGATVALVLGVYDRLLGAIRGFDRTLAARLARLDLAGAAGRIDAGFLVPLVLGAAAAVAFFTRVLSIGGLMEAYPDSVRSFFFGLVAGAAITLLREAMGGTMPRARDLIAAGAGVGGGWWIAVVVPAATPEAAWFVFLAGTLAAGAMILPGISGALVLVLLKKYAYVLAAVGRLDLAVLVPFGLGAAIGLALVSRVLAWLLGRRRRVTLFALAGVIVGSLWSLWPYREAAGVHSVPTWPGTVDAFDVLVGAAGMGLVGLLHFVSRRGLAPAV